MHETGRYHTCACNRFGDRESWCRGVCKARASAGKSGKCVIASVAVGVSVGVSVRNSCVCTRHGDITPAVVPVVETAIVGVVVSAREGSVPVITACALL